MNHASPFTAFIVVGAGTGINTVRQLQRGHNAFPTIIAGVAFGTICVALNDTTGADFGTMLAIIFLLTSFLTNGVTFLDTLTKVVEAY